MLRRVGRRLPATCADFVRIEGEFAHHPGKVPLVQEATVRRGNPGEIASTGIDAATNSAHEVLCSCSRMVLASPVSDREPEPELERSACPDAACHGARRRSLDRRLGARPPSRHRAAPAGHSPRQHAAGAARATEREGGARGTSRGRVSIEDPGLALPFTRMLRARELRLKSVGGLAAEAMSYAISRHYRADLEAHWYIGQYVLPGNVQRIILKPKVLRLRMLGSDLSAHSPRYRQ